MLRHTVYTVITPANSTLGVNLPIAVDLDATTKASLVEQEDSIQLLIDRKIDHTKLELVKDSWHPKELPDVEHEPIPTLRLVDDEAPEYILAQDFISILTFFEDIPITLSKPFHGDQFVPETDEDRELLERFGTDKPYDHISVLSSMRSFSTRGITNKTVTDLMSKRVGLRLYANAMKANLAVAQFRELWRILEAAFCKKDRELVTLLAQYEPASKLGFDETEIRQLWILRGRASHAESKAGIKELVYVDQECTKRLPRLKNLCERVILTKKDWGYPKVDTDELLPLTSFVGPDNGITIFQKHFLGISSDQNITE